MANNGTVTVCFYINVVLIAFQGYNVLRKYCFYAFPECN